MGARKSFESMSHSQKLAASLYEINKAAKRRRDMAQRFYCQCRYTLATRRRREKEYYYDLKGRALSRALEAEDAALIGYHTSNNIVFEYCRIGSTTVHNPLLSPEREIREKATKLESLEVSAKRSGTQCRLRDAEAFLEEYTDGINSTTRYGMPPRERDDSDYYYDEDDYDDEDDFYFQG